MPSEGPYHDVDAGGYLRLEAPDGGPTLTVMTPKGMGIRAHWDPSGYTDGPKRKRWDITLPREAAVALQYQLAARGRLRVRERAEP